MLLRRLLGKSPILFTTKPVSILTTNARTYEYRASGWHESGCRADGDPREHLDVRFFDSNGTFVTAHHVYPTNEDYPPRLVAKYLRTR